VGGRAQLHIRVANDGAGRPMVRAHAAAQCIISSCAACMLPLGCRAHACLLTMSAPGKVLPPLHAVAVRYPRACMLACNNE
jgi:hypothetical protein